MMSVDTNVLVYAHRSEFQEHGAAKRALMELADGDDLWALPVFCVAEFMRVVTHPSILKPPSLLDDALHAMATLLTSHSLRVLFPGQRFPNLLLDTIRKAGVKGNLVFDAQIVALCREHGVRRLLTNDRDFARFEDVELEMIG